MRFIRFFIFVLLIIYSCESETPLTPAQQLENMPGITLDMDENLLLTVGVINLDFELGYLGFELSYANEKLSNGGTLISGDYNLVFSSFDYDNISKDSLSLIFSGVSGTGDLFKLQFEGSSYKGVIIRFVDTILIDTNDIPTNETVDIEMICYIDEGVLIQGTENTSEPIEDWSPTGNYIWTNYFCPYY